MKTLKTTKIIETNIFDKEFYKIVKFFETKIKEGVWEDIYGDFNIIDGVFNDTVFAYYSSYDGLEDPSCFIDLMDYGDMYKILIPYDLVNDDDYFVFINTKDKEKVFKGIKKFLKELEESAKESLKENQRYEAEEKARKLAEAKRPKLCPCCQNFHNHK